MALAVYTIILSTTSTVPLTPSQFRYDMNIVLGCRPSYCRGNTSVRETKRLESNNYGDKVRKMKAI